MRHTPRPRSFSVHVDLTVLSRPPAGLCMYIAYGWVDAGTSSVVLSVAIAFPTGFSRLPSTLESWALRDLREANARQPRPGKELLQSLQMRVNNSAQYETLRLRECRKHAMLSHSAVGLSQLAGNRQAQSRSVFRVEKIQTDIAGPISQSSQVSL
jgi:hypothetical protein